MSFWRTLLMTGSLLAPIVVGLTYAAPAAAARIACVGDSITFGYGLSNPDTQSYPVVLQTLLGTTHTVRNFGVSGCTLLKKGDRPYWSESAYTTSGTFDPDVVVIMLGTNDAKPQNWSRQSEFAPDYRALVDHYRSLGAFVYIAAPPPVYAPGAFDISPDVLNNQIVPLVRQIAAEVNAPLIDVFQALGGKPNDFSDKVHPTAQGAHLIADTVAAALQENGFGGAGGSGNQGGDAGAGGAHQGGPAGGHANGGGSAGVGNLGGNSGRNGNEGGSGGIGNWEGSAGRNPGDEPGTGGKNGGTTGSGGAPGAGGGRIHAGGSLATTGGYVNGAAGRGSGLGGASDGATGGVQSNMQTGGTRRTNDGGTNAVSNDIPPTKTGCGCRTGGGGSLSLGAQFIAGALWILLLDRRRRRSPHIARNTRRPQ